MKPKNWCSQRIPRGCRCCWCGDHTLRITNLNTVQMCSDSEHIWPGWGRFKSGLPVWFDTPALHQLPWATQLQSLPTTVGAPSFLLLRTFLCGFQYSCVFFKFKNNFICYFFFCLEQTFFCPWLSVASHLLGVASFFSSVSDQRGK